MEATAARTQRRDLASRTQLLAELRGLRVRELRARAAALGIDDRDVERAIDDGCDPRGDLVTLIVNKHDAIQRSREAGADTGVRMPSPPAWGSPIGTPERSGSSLFTRRHPQQRGAERVPSPHPYLQSPVRHGQTAQDAMHVGMRQEQAVGLLSRSEWQTQTVDVERTIIEPMALRHTVPKKRLVSRTYATSCGTPQVVLEQETYYTTEMRVVDVSVTVVQQEKREVLATVWEPEQRPLQQRAADFPLARTVSAGEVIDERSMVGAPGSTDWRFQNRTAGSTTARSRTPMNSVSTRSASSSSWKTEQDEMMDALQMQRLRGRPALPVGPSALPFGTAPVPDADADREVVSKPLV